MRKLSTVEEVHDLLSASTRSAALAAAIELGLFWLLAERPLDAAGVSCALSIPGNRGRYWLQLLTALGMLEETPQGYAPSPLARAAILDRHSQDSWRHLMLDERERSAGVHNLALVLAAPGSIWTAQGTSRPPDYVEKMRDDPARAREFTRMLYELHQGLASELAAALDLSGVRRLLDLGGGSGVVALTLLHRHPELTATVVDLETVCTAGREIAAEHGLSDRITYRPVDFVHDELPDGFDLAVQCDVGVFGDEHARKLWSALNPGGRLVMVEHFAPAEGVLPAARLEWTFLDSLHEPDVSIPTAAQVRAQLAQAGFQVLPDEKALPDRRVVLQARK